MAKSNVPEFGNWDSQENVPYTMYFDKARKNRGRGKMINPNDPQENPEVFPKPDDPVAKVAVQPENEQRESKGDGDNRQPYKSPARGENPGQKIANESNYGMRGQRPARPARISGESEQSMERSPLHHQAKIIGLGSASPIPDGKNYDNSRGDHGKARLKPATRGDESPDVGATVPKFGAWDETDPSSAEQFTGIFDKVREERNSGVGNVSGTPRHPSHNNRGNQATKQSKCCCIL